MVDRVGGQNFVLLSIVKYARVFITHAALLHIMCDVKSSSGFCGPLIVTPYWNFPPKISINFKIA